MSERDRLIDIVARAAFPAAFDRTSFDAMADINTRAGDFERGQEHARERAAAALFAAEAIGFLIVPPDDGR